MKVLLSPDFATKLTAIPQESVAKILHFVQQCEGLTHQGILDNTAFSISLLDENVYAVKIDAGRLYLTFEGEGADEYIVLLDFAAVESTPRFQNNFYTSRNPKTNSQLNPKFNSLINPKFNSLINPKFNSSINPKFNSSINPMFNSLINPKFNSSINPKFNSSINPKFNSSINPKFNTSINPRFNRSYDGPYIYDLSLNQVGYIVKANDKVDLIFSIDNEFSGMLVKAQNNTRVRFDEDSNFIGYAVSANEQVSLLYSKDNDWNGLLI